MTRATLSRGIVLSMFLAAALLSLTACGGKTVQRIGTDTTVDIAQVLANPWLARYEATHSDRPTVIVGTVRNNSSEHIDTNIFTKNLEIAFINSGRVRVVASRDERGEVREERDSQQDWSDPATVKKMGMELGADYMLIGSVGSIVDEEGKDKVIFYQTNLELIDIQTNEKVWIGQKQIKKYIGKSKYKA